MNDTPLDTATMECMAGILRRGAVAVVRPEPEAAVSAPAAGRRKLEAASLKKLGASLERLQELLETAPDVAVRPDRELLHWTAIVPSRNGEDEQRASAATLADLVSQLETVLTKRAEAGRTYLRGTLDVLRMAWGTAFEIGWHGLWWYQRHDGTGGRVTAPTPEALSRLMGQDQREERTDVHAYRNIRHADDAALEAMQAAAKNLLDAYERFLGGDLVEGLCRFREAAQAEAGRRSRAVVPADLAAHTRAAG